jgi:hypothetical protein
MVGGRFRDVRLETVYIDAPKFGGSTACLPSATYAGKAKGAPTRRTGRVMLRQLSRVHPIWIFFGFFSLSLLPIIAGASGLNLNSSIFKISFVVLVVGFWLLWPFAVLTERMRGRKQQSSNNEVVVLSIALACLMVLLSVNQVFDDLPNSVDQIVFLLLIFAVLYLSRLFAAAWDADIVSFFKFVCVFFAIYFLPIGAFFLWHISRPNSRLKD